MLKCVFVPNSVLIENEELISLRASEHHLWIEQVATPHQIGTWNCLWCNLLEVLDIDNASFYRSEWVSFLKDNLLSVWEKLCMPAEVLLLNHSSWVVHSAYECW